MKKATQFKKEKDVIPEWARITLLVIVVLAFLYGLFFGTGIPSSDFPSFRRG